MKILEELWYGNVTPGERYKVQLIAQIRKVKKEDKVCSS